MLSTPVYLLHRRLWCNSLFSLSLSSVAQNGLTLCSEPKHSEVRSLSLTSFYPVYLFWSVFSVQLNCLCRWWWWCSVLQIVSLQSGSYTNLWSFVCDDLKVKYVWGRDATQRAAQSSVLFHTHTYPYSQTIFSFIFLFFCSCIIIEMYKQNFVVLNLHVWEVFRYITNLTSFQLLYMLTTFFMVWYYRS